MAETSPPAVAFTFGGTGQTLKPVSLANQQVSFTWGAIVCTITVGDTQYGNSPGGSATPPIPENYPPNTPPPSIPFGLDPTIQLMQLASKSFQGHTVIQYISFIYNSTNYTAGTNDGNGTVLSFPNGILVSINQIASGSYIDQLAFQSSQ
jgi:hypothetical protein